MHATIFSTGGEIPPCFDFYVVTRSYSSHLFLCALDQCYARANSPWSSQESLERVGVGMTHIVKLCSIDMEDISSSEVHNQTADYRSSLFSQPHHWEDLGRGKRSTAKTKFLLCFKLTLLVLLCY